MALVAVFIPPMVGRRRARFARRARQTARFVSWWAAARWIFRWEVRRDIDRLNRSPYGLKILREITPGLPPGE